MTRQKARPTPSALQVDARNEQSARGGAQCQHSHRTPTLDGQTRTNRWLSRRDNQPTRPSPRQRRYPTGLAVHAHESGQPPRGEHAASHPGRLATYHGVIIPPGRRVRHSDFTIDAHVRPDTLCRSALPRFGRFAGQSAIATRASRVGTDLGQPQRPTTPTPRPQFSRREHASKPLNSNTDQSRSACHHCAPSTARSQCPPIEPAETDTKLRSEP